jgi:tetraacyldisaccharide 4'-kinase
MSLLPDATSFKRLADGSARGLAAGVLRATLRALAAPYGGAVRVRNRAYDLGLLPIHACNAPVVCIGNVSLGGTGKTPLVAWAAQHLAALGMRPAIVSRGYGARRGELSDEAAELGLLLPGVPHVADPDRVAAARRAVAAGADAVVLDDGFQHRRLARDLDIVAVDATDPFGCGFLVPRGLLREPMHGLARADAVVLTRCTLADPARRADIRTALARHASGLPPVWAEATHRPVGLRQAGGETQPLDSLRGRRVVACAGIGNPAAFRESLQSLGADVAAFRAFPDHHAYSPRDLDELGAWAARERATLLVTTLKDLVKIRRDDLSGIQVAALEIAIEFTAGGDDLAGLLASVVPPVATFSSRRGACASAAEVNTS